MLTVVPELLHAVSMHCAACDRDHPLGPGDRVGFRDACDHCGADLHTCTHCAHFDRDAYNECRESGAERVLDKERANRCDWFSAGDERGGDGSKKTAALSDLDRLFKK